MLFRSLYAVYEQEVTVKNVPAWKYIIPPEIFEAPAKNKNNYCFCPDLENEPLCQYNGAVTLASCQAGKWKYLYNGKLKILQLLVQYLKFPVRYKDNFA